MPPPEFFLGENLYQKLLFLAILAAVRPHGESWVDCGHLGDPPLAKFCKTFLRVLGQIYTKNYPFGDFGGSKPTSLKPKGLNLALGCRPATHSPCKIL